MTIIYIDNKKYEVDDLKNVLHNCLLLGKDIPYFCWHPLLGSVGSCRQCAIKLYSNKNDKVGRVVMACMTPSKDGIKVSIQDKDVQKFRRSIIELLMLNHPHDCPVCAEGGSCHLQDMTVMAGHLYRRYRFPKRIYKNQYLGPFISHEMNRCIHCYRCVRYYKDYAQGTDFNVYGISNNIYFGRVEDGILENEHSGNLIELCPTGVFTDKTSLKNYNRKWDLQYAPSICHFCSIGCNIIVGERYGKVQKIENRFNPQVNHYFICDKGRFGYGFNHRDSRPYKPKYFTSNSYKNLTTNEAIRLAQNVLKKSSKIIGIGSSRASIESNYALLKLVGSKNFSSGMLQDEQLCMNYIVSVLNSKEFHIPTLYEIENNYDVALVVGEDLTMNSPRMALSLRQMIKRVNNDEIINKNIDQWNHLAILNIAQNKKNILYNINTNSTKLDELSSWNYITSIPNQVKFFLELINQMNNQSISNDFCDPFLTKKVLEIAEVLLNSKRPLIICGSHSRNVNLLKSVVKVATIIKKMNAESEIGVVLLSDNANSMGVSLISSISIEKSLSIFEKTKNSVLIIVENDLYRMFSTAKLKTIFNNNKTVIVLDHQNTMSMIKGSLTFPSTSFFESSGTIVNYEGRAQRFFKVYDPNVYQKDISVMDSWRWLKLIGKNYYITNNTWNNLDDIINDYANNIDQFRNIRKAAPNSYFRIINQKIPRLPNRNSGRTALMSHINVHEIKQPTDVDSMFAFSMEGFPNFYKYSSHIPFIWMPGWNSPQAWNKLNSTKNLRCFNNDLGIQLFDKKYIAPNVDCKIDQKKVYERDGLRIIIYYLFFGSEEITQYSSLIKTLIPKTIGLISFEDSKRLQLKHNAQVQFNCFGSLFSIKLKISNNFPVGYIGLPLGKIGMPLSLLGQAINFLKEAL
ncbi:NADH dehydrogenase I chain G [Buchnera aphidicola (Nipponaphis monzeni)]|uniref:NADH-quinone oxidoreductase subunit G n=1 Tax=Buchnera aphidicola (Nipponaphis monzeni) TaxID=2495405 RepID=A0A455T9Y6_9GAMM|nr:NADH-quinone oxidoreductase subunit NuoG [Buchnera aphidicola]BBI01142.1 NADH dehydrogenase I chain G [Buchnera aphidicola (Nipponaphis monzeni)]